jgi:multiple sugar transport system substrate-binding protein
MYDTINKYKITPSDVLSWDEEPSRRPFTAGQSVFLRNWNYVWSIAQDKAQSEIVDKVEVAPLPHFAGKQSAACLGGYQYGVNAFFEEQRSGRRFFAMAIDSGNATPFCDSGRLCPRPASSLR